MHVFNKKPFRAIKSYSRQSLSYICSLQIMASNYPNTSSSSPSANMNPTPSTSSTTNSTSTYKKSANDFAFLSLIGEGSFSTVIKAKELKTGKYFAIKICEKQHIRQEKMKDAIMREKNIMNILNDNLNPYFVRLYCTFQDEYRLYFTMNYAINGELLNYITKVGTLSEECIRFYTAQIVLALEHLHRLGIIHRDLKPENILLNERMHIQVSDFGSACILKSEEIDDIRDNEIDGENLNELENTRTENEMENLSLQQSAENQTNQANFVNQESEIRENVENRQNAANLNNSKNTENVTNNESGENWRNAQRTNDSTAPNSLEDRPRRKYSFVGTAQYVSPEILTNKKVCRGTDLWALGCIIYQMATGNLAFKAANEYLIFQKILCLDYTFTDEINDTIKNLVQNFLKINPIERLGAKDLLIDRNTNVKKSYSSIRNHEFFAPLNDKWSTLHEMEAPKMERFTPKSEILEESNTNDCDIKPGLDDKQMTRLLGLALYDEKENRVMKKYLMLNGIDKDEFEKMLNAQKESSPWHRFVQNNLILKKGFIDKKVGLFSKRRMFLLTTGPHIYYVDPIHMILKGEIPWSKQLRPEYKNFRNFFVHTPKRMFNLEDPEGNAPDWCKAINDVQNGFFDNESYCGI